MPGRPQPCGAGAPASRAGQQCRILARGLGPLGVLAAPCRPAPEQGHPRGPGRSCRLTAALEVARHPFCNILSLTQAALFAVQASRDRDTRRGGPWGPSWTLAVKAANTTGPHRALWASTFISLFICEDTGQPRRLNFGQKV